MRRQAQRDLRVDEVGGRSIRRRRRTAGSAGCDMGCWCSVDGLEADAEPADRGRSPGLWSCRPRRCLDVVPGEGGPLCLASSGRGQAKPSQVAPASSTFWISSYRTGPGRCTAGRAGERGGCRRPGDSADRQRARELGQLRTATPPPARGPVPDELIQKPRMRRHWLGFALSATAWRPGTTAPFTGTTSAICAVGSHQTRHLTAIAVHRLQGVSYQTPISTAPPRTGRPRRRPDRPPPRPHQPQFTLA